MIFAHGPLGALAARTLWPATTAFNFTRAQLVILLIIGLIGGIFPDIDLIYASYVDGSEPHRAFLTHTMPIYLGIWSIGLLVLILLRRKVGTFPAFAWSAFFFGVLTHLITDMIAASVRFFYPFSEAYFGLSNISNETLSENLLFVNFLVEGFIIAGFLLLLIKEFITEEKQRPLGLGVGVLTAIGVLTLLVGNMHIYKGPALAYYADTDADSIPQYEDLDMDGDGIPNISDDDSDGDGIDNVVEIQMAGQAFDRVWYDPVDGGLIRIPERMGFPRNADIPWRAYRGVGILLDTEMRADYALQSDGYATEPTDHVFAYNAQNLRAWLSHIGRLDQGENVNELPSRLGDILFTDNGAMYLVMGFDEGGWPKVVNAKKQHAFGGVITIESFDALQTREGLKVIARGTPLYESHPE